MSLVVLALGMSLVGSSAQDACDSALTGLERVHSRIHQDNATLVSQFNTAIQAYHALRPDLEACLNDHGVVFSGCEERNLSARIYEIRREIHRVRDRSDDLMQQGREQRNRLDQACRGQVDTSADHRHNLQILDDVMAPNRDIREIETEVQADLSAYARQAGRLFGGRQILNGGLMMDDQTQRYVGLALPDEVYPSVELIRRGDAYRSNGLSELTIAPGGQDSSIFISLGFPENALRVVERPVRRWTHEGEPRVSAPRLDVNLRFSRRDMLTVSDFEMSESVLDLVFEPVLAGANDAPVAALQIACRSSEACISARGGGPALSEIVLPVENAAFLYERLISLQHAAVQSTFEACNPPDVGPDRADACFQMASIYKHGLAPEYEAWPARWRRLLGQSCLWGSPDGCSAFEAMMESAEGEGLDQAVSFAEGSCELGYEFFCGLAQRPDLNPAAFPELVPVEGAELLELDGQFAVQSCSEFRCSFKASVQTGPNAYYEEWVQFRQYSYTIRISEYNCEAREVSQRSWQFATADHMEDGFEETNWTFTDFLAGRVCSEVSGAYTIQEARNLAEDERPD